LEDFIMKTQLAILAAVVVGTSAWADGGGRGGGGGHHGPDICDVCDHDIVIKGPQIQSTSLHNSFSVASARPRTGALPCVMHNPCVYAAGAAPRQSSLSAKAYCQDERAG